MRVYCDMVGDLFHAGHASFCQRAREVGRREIERRRRAGGGAGSGAGGGTVLTTGGAAAAGERVVLIVGITNDHEAIAYKRLPVMTNAERVSCARACRYVDEVVPSAPLVTSRAFMDAHAIDLVVHGDDYTDDKVRTYYGAALAEDRYRTVPYTPGISTSDLIRRAQARPPIGSGGSSPAPDAAPGTASTARVAVVAASVGVLGFVAGVAWARRGTWVSCAPC